MTRLNVYYLTGLLAAVALTSACQDGKRRIAGALTEVYDISARSGELFGQRRCMCEPESVNAASTEECLERREPSPEVDLEDLEACFYQGLRVFTSPPRRSVAYYRCDLKVAEMLHACDEALHEHDDPCSEEADAQRNACKDEAFSVGEKCDELLDEESRDWQRVALNYIEHCVGVAGGE
jgi:hypothetical protein